MNKILHLLFVLFLLLISCRQTQKFKSIAYKEGDLIEISGSVLQDKIKGGWAGQVIGCTYGGPVEFRFNGTFIGDHIPIPWDEHQIITAYKNRPGLYDDIYMDLTFVEVFEEYGLDTSDSLHALAFAHAEYPLWHANQAARYNILNGIMPPASGHWKNNPHADDIDFQIEADFAGLMSPGMPNSATKICDKIGRIMNYGDGLYGGMYVAAMYSLTFMYNDIDFIVREALKVVPAESNFYRCIADVISWYDQFPEDWKRTWFEAQKKWTYDKGCPNGVFKAFNIDAKINAAYIVIGLLYGEKDFGKTIDISTRCGYDSDCNPANAAGILGAMIGYNQIPGYWKQGLDKVEDIDFQYTNMSLNRVYKTGYKHAAEMIIKEGGREENGKFFIKYQEPVSVPLEIGFEGLYPLEIIPLNATLNDRSKEYSFPVKGCGFVISGRAYKDHPLPDTTIILDVFIDDAWYETIKMSTNSLHRRLEVAWKYDLPEGDHNIRLVLKDPIKGYGVQTSEVLLYSTFDPGKRTYF